MTGETKKPGATPETTSKGKAGTELDDAALDNVSGGGIYIQPEPPKPTIDPKSGADWIILTK